MAYLSLQSELLVLTADSFSFTILSDQTSYQSWAPWLIPGNLQAMAGPDDIFCKPFRRDTHSADRILTVSKPSRRNAHSPIRKCLRQQKKWANGVEGKHTLRKSEQTVSTKRGGPLWNAKNRAKVSKRCVREAYFWKSEHFVSTERLSGNARFWSMSLLIVIVN